MNKVNSVILPKTEEKQSLDHPALYNTFNFTKLIRDDSKKK